MDRSILFLVRYGSVTGRQNLKHMEEDRRVIYIMPILRSSDNLGSTILVHQEGPSSGGRQVL